MIESTMIGLEGLAIIFNRSIAYSNYKQNAYFIALIGFSLLFVMQSLLFAR
jgi:hypothetical protein